MLIIGLTEADIWPDRLVLDLSSVNGAPPVGFKSLGDRAFLLAADDECDRIEQPCFVRAHLASASGNQACQCQRQNGLNFQVSLPAPAFDRKYRKRQIRRACEAVAVRAGRSPFLARSDHFPSNSTGCRKRRMRIAHRINIEGTRSAQAQPLLHPKCVSVAERAA